jgi:integrase
MKETYSDGYKEQALVKVYNRGAKTVREEIQAILSRLNGTNWLIASLLYGTGMRIMECLRLRVQDVDMKRREILIRDDLYTCVEQGR